MFQPLVRLVSLLLSADPFAATGSNIPEHYLHSTRLLASRTTSRVFPLCLVHRCGLDRFALRGRIWPHDRSNLQRYGIWNLNERYYVFLLMSFIFFCVEWFCNRSSNDCAFPRAGHLWVRLCTTDSCHYAMADASVLHPRRSRFRGIGSFRI